MYRLGGACDTQLLTGVTGIQKVSIYTEGIWFYSDIFWDKSQNSKGCFTRKVCAMFHDVHVCVQVLTCVYRGVSCVYRGVSCVYRVLHT